MKRCGQHSDFSRSVPTDQEATTDRPHEASGDARSTVQDGPTCGSPSVLFDEQRVGQRRQEGAGKTNHQAQRQCPPEWALAQQLAEGTGPVFG